MKQEIKTIAEQINFRELRLAGFKFAFSDKDTSLTIRKGIKFLTISLDEGKDLYSIRKVRVKNIATIVQDETQEGIFCDMLCDTIEEFFNFNYINKVRFG